MLSCLKYFLIERLLTSKRGRRPSSGSFMLDHRRRSQRSIRRRMRGFLINAKRSPAASRRALRSKSTTTNSATRGFLLSVLRRISPLSTLSNRGTRYLGIIHPPLGGVPSPVDTQTSQTVGYYSESYEPVTNGAGYSDSGVLTAVSAVIS